MPLSEDQQDRLARWLEQRGAGNQCPSCGRNEWATGDIVSAPVFTGGGIAIGGPTVPMVQLVCGNCAFVRLHAAVPVGLIGP
jgi:hypothetical protein